MENYIILTKTVNRNCKVQITLIIETDENKKLLTYDLFKRKNFTSKG
jgi:hypothetical protein